LPDEAAGQHGLARPTTAAGHRGAGGFQPNVIPGRWNSGGRRSGPEASSNQPASAQAQDSEELVSLPLYGRIAAGTPIEALRDDSTLLQVPRGLLGRGDHY